MKDLLYTVKIGNDLWEWGARMKGFFSVHILS